MKRAVVLAGTIVAWILTTAAPATAGDTVCEGPVGVLTGPHDNIVVPSGVHCVVTNAFVTGSIKALEGSSLTVFENVTVLGNIEGDKAAAMGVGFGGVTVFGNIQIKQGGPPAATGQGFTAVANVQGVYLPYGNIEVQQNSGGNVWIGNQVPNIVSQGSVAVDENVIPPDGSLEIGYNSVGGNLRVSKNTGGFLKSVQNNTVGQNLQCAENDGPFSGRPNIAGKAEGQCF